MKRQEMGFVERLISSCLKSKQLEERGIYIFNVIAKYGSYQVIIGPEYTKEEARKLGLMPHTRKLTINGSIYNLFINKDKVSAIPDEREISKDLNGSIIMRNIHVHIVDPDGKGKEAMGMKNDRSKVIAHQKINLAGEDGRELLVRYQSTGRLFSEIYKIVQEDIIRSMETGGSKTH